MKFILHKWTTRARLITTFLFVVILMVLCALNALNAFQKQHEAFLTLKNDTLSKITRVGQLSEQSSTRAISARNAVISGNKSQQVAELSSAARAGDVIDVLISEGRQSGTVAERRDGSAQGELAELEKIGEVEERYRKVLSNVADALLAQDVTEANRLLLEECNPILLELGSNMQALMKLHVTEADLLQQQNELHYKTSLYECFAIALLGISVSATLLWQQMRSLGNNLGGEPAQLSELAALTATGDLTTLPEEESSNCSGLAMAIYEMRNGLRTLVSESRSIAASVSIGAREIATGSLDLSSRTESHASNLQEITNSLQALTEELVEINELVRLLAKLSSDSRSGAIEGEGRSQEALRTMKEIETKSNEITGIISLIDTISFQTNILALNAAVEAARAGELGRGFAVVAGEVRTLAHRSAEAAKEVGSLINKNAESVSQGSRMMIQSAECMQEIAARVSAVEERLGVTLRGVSRVSAGILKVNEMLSSFERGIQQNAALVEQSTAASESLSHQAILLTSQMNRFRI